MAAPAPAAPAASAAAAAGAAGAAGEAEQEARRHNRCVAYMEHALGRSPFAKFMLDALDRAGCAFGRQHFICEPCDNRGLAGGFVPNGERGRRQRVDEDDGEGLSADEDEGEGLSARG